MSGNRRVERIFHAVLGSPAQQQAEVLARLCGSDATVLADVQSLLRADADPVSIGAPPAIRTAADSAATVMSATTGGEGPGDVIGPYKLLERIGEGGFGSVYLAEQREPVRRSVALKIIKLGMDTRQVIARFEAERQALAMMDHPNIARVLDAGATETGRPYFVMELVKGVPVTQYCDDHRVALPERLALFTDVCHAVQHAHQKGIIHRDLKPTNVLVSRHDDRPVVKVIDFGIAKATGVQLTDKTLHTEWRHLIGTPTYMSPEQAGMSDLDVDTRSDIYALGVLLYELLTGTTPFDPQELVSSGFDEMRRIIREVEPPKPSTRVASAPRGGRSVAAGAGRRSEPLTRVRGQSEPRAQARGIGPTPPAPDVASSSIESPRADAWHSDSSAAAIASLRQSDPRLLARSLRGDLDWIVMKCLEKDRTRRYETANGLAADVQRYQAGEPVVAAPPSNLYRLRKTLRRNRAAATVAAVFVLLVTSAAVAFGLMYRNAEEHKKLAERREAETRKVAEFQAGMLSDIDVEAMGRGIKERLRDQVRAALERQYVGEYPDRRKRTPEEIEAELAAFDQRADAAHAVDVARRVMDEFVLARAADALEKEFAEHPLVRADLHFALGRTYSNLGLYDAAEPHLRLALEARRGHYGPDASPEVAAGLYNLAGLMCHKGRDVEAEALYQESLAMWRELSDEKLVPRTLHALGGILVPQRRFAEAEPMLEEALRLHREVYGEEHELVMHSLAALAYLRYRQGRLDEAEAGDQKVLAWRRERFGNQHEEVALSLSNLSQTLSAQQRHAEAEELLREALAILVGVHGDEHPDVAKRRFQLGRVIIRQGRRREGEELYRQALAQQRAMLGDEHAEVRVTLRDLADSRLQDGHPEEAVPLLREALAITERVYPDGHPAAFRRYSTMNMLGVALDRQAKATLDADRARALALVDEAERLTWDGVVGMTGMPLENLEDRRRTLESVIASLAHWHEVDPDGGWEERAVKWKAELEKIPGP